MGSPFWINNNRNPNDNFTIRLDDLGGGEFKERNTDAIGRELEEIMLWQNSLFANFNMILPTWFLYNDFDPGDGGWIEGVDPLNSNRKIFRKVFVPSSELNSLVGFDALIVNYINDIAIQWARGPIANNPNNNGLLGRLQGEITGGLQQAAGFNMSLFSSSFDLGILQTATDNLDLDEVLNALRAKLTVLFAESDRYKIYNILSSIYPLETGVGNRLLGPENLLCEDLWRTENGSLLSDCTAVGKGAGTSNFYVAFAPILNQEEDEVLEPGFIRKYGETGQPVQHANESFSLSNIGDSEFDPTTAIAFLSPNILYIRSGKLFKMAPDGSANEEIVIETTDFDTVFPVTTTAFAGFDDIIISSSGKAFVKKGDDLIELENSTFNIQTDLTVWNINGSGKKICDLPMLPPLKRYFNTPGARVFNDDNRGVNLFVASSSGSGQVSGIHEIPFLTVGNFKNLQLDGTDAIEPLPLGSGPFASGNPSQTGRRKVRGIARIGIEALIDETELNNSELSISLRFIRRAVGDDNLAEGISEATVFCHIYTGNFIPSGIADYNARGTLIGVVSTERIFSLTQQVTFHQFGKTDEWRSDGFLYLIFSIDRPLFAGGFNTYNIDPFLSVVGKAP